MRTAALGLCALVLTAGICHAAAPEPLVLERKIPLGRVGGRIDHFALDQAGRRLFLAELGNNSVSVTDIPSGMVIHRITGLSEPQGVAFVAETGMLYVANGGDGAVRLFHAPDFTPAGQVDLKDDADNLRVDAANHMVVAGFGSGALAMIDSRAGKKTAEVRLNGHPESFQLEPGGARIFVNVPDAREIAVVDTGAGRQTAAWTLPGLRANFPMALAEGRLVVVTRAPARLAVLDTATGAVTANLPACGDADDVFVDQKRRRAYVSCGQGVIDVFTMEQTPAHLAQVRTVTGARTAFFDAESDRLFLAVRASGAEPASIWEFRPQ